MHVVLFCNEEHFKHVIFKIDTHAFCYTTKAACKKKKNLILTDTPEISLLRNHPCNQQKESNLGILDSCKHHLPFSHLL